MRDSRLSKIEFGFTDELTKVGYVAVVGAALRGAGALARGLSAMGAIRGGQSAGQAGIREGTDNPLGGWHEKLTGIRNAVNAFRGGKDPTGGASMSFQSSAPPGAVAN